MCAHVQDSHAQDSGSNACCASAVQLLTLNKTLNNTPRQIQALRAAAAHTGADALACLAASRAQPVCLYVSACMCLLVCVCLYVSACMSLLVCLCLYVSACKSLLVSVCMSPTPSIFPCFLPSQPLPLAVELTN